MPPGAYYKMEGRRFGVGERVACAVEGSDERVVWAAGSERLTHGLKAAGTHHTITERDEHVKQKRQGAHPWRKRALVLSKHIIK